MGSSQGYAFALMRYAKELIDSLLLFIVEDYNEEMSARSEARLVILQFNHLLKSNVLNGGVVYGTPGYVAIIGPDVSVDLNNYLRDCQSIGMRGLWLILLREQREQCEK